MFCPKCKTEYRPGFTHCADCDVDLVWELPKKAIELRQTGDSGEYAVPGGPGDPNEDPFCSFWKGEDPRVHAELCTVLDEAGIPHHTVFRRDHLFNLTNLPSYTVGVPFSMFERAGKVIKEAYGTDDVADVGSQELQLTPESPLPSLRRLPDSLTPSEDENIPGPPTAGTDSNWYAEDASVQIWTSTDSGSRDFLVAALHENGIHCRLERDDPHAAIFVLPADEIRAREILREMLEGAPPE